MTDATTTRPPFDEELRPIIEAIRAEKPMTRPDTLDDVRAGAAAADAEIDFTAGGQVEVSELVAEMPGAEPVSVIVLRPAGAREDALPGIYYLHPGGIVAGTKKTDLSILLRAVIETGAVVVSPEYRLAPEHPFPAAIDDAYTGLVWMASNAAELGVDADRLLVAGVSGGGNLAAAVALLARDRKGPAISHQVLMCPMLDDRLQTHSSQMLDGEGSWDRVSNQFAWDAYLGVKRGGPEVSEYAAPARALDLAGLPRTYLDVGSVDTFRDEIIDYATRLSQAGVLVDFHLWGGGYHGFDMPEPETAIARAAVETRNEFLRRALTGVAL